MKHLEILFGIAKCENETAYYIVYDQQELFNLKSKFYFEDQSFNSAVNTLQHSLGRVFAVCVYDKEFSSTIDVSNYDFISIL